jgi:hypothetical protein
MTTGLQKHNQPLAPINAMATLHPVSTTWMIEPEAREHPSISACVLRIRARRVALRSGPIIPETSLQWIVFAAGRSAGSKPAGQSRIFRLQGPAGPKPAGLSFLRLYCSARIWPEQVFVNDY